MQGRRYWTLAPAIFLTLLGATAISEAQSPPAIIPGAKVVQMADELSPTDIVTQGKKLAGGDCYFEEGTWISTAAPSDGQGKWLLIEIDDSCRAKVKAKWRGRLEDGPAIEIKTLQKALSGFSAPVKLESQVAGISATLGYKSSYQEVFTYGLGGTWDWLTRLTGFIDFEYNGREARIRYQYGGCAGKVMPTWYWSVDYCARTGINYGPSYAVWRTGRGDYHCHPATAFPCNLSEPDGYYHKIYDSIIGYANGVAYCSFSWSGTVVRGPTRIVEGCF